MKEKIRSKMFYILLFVLILILLVVFLSRYASDQEKDKTNLSGDDLSVSENNDTQVEEIVRIDGTKQVGDIEISNIQIKLVDKNKSEFSADVKNLSDKFLESTNLEIRVIDENGEVSEIFGGIITELAGYEPSNFTTYVLADITNAKDIEFEVIEN